MLAMGNPNDLALLTSAEDRPGTILSFHYIPYLIYLFNTHFIYLLLCYDSFSERKDAEHPISDDIPLFVRTCRRGFVVPLPGNLSPMRLNVFRNVGRYVLSISLLKYDVFVELLVYVSPKESFSLLN